MTESAAAPPARRGFDPLVYRAPEPAPWLIHALGPVNRWGILRGALKLTRIDFPAADLARLRAAVNPGTVAFLGPHHPEFTTDWMLDKEISRLVSPLMAHWASWEIVNLNPPVQTFFVKNNLIANVPGGGGKEYSVRWALAGHGVLLHPEGTASWHGDRVGRLLPGIADMAWEACRRLREAGTPRPVWLVPIVWKLHFTRDVSRGLVREMTHIERALELATGDHMPVMARFARLLRSVLLRQCARFEFTSPLVRADLPPASFFEAQRAFTLALLERLEAVYGASEGDVGRRQHALRRAIRAAAADPEQRKRDRAMVLEIERLQSFTREHYDVPTLTQEQIAESLKRIRTSLVFRGFANSFHNLVPVAVAGREAHIRVPEPIAVHEVWTSDETQAESRQAALIETHRARMQRELDALNAGIAPVVDRFRRDNPMWTGGAG
jgi:hypothetical protein